jgi:hypothetical protein
MRARRMAVEAGHPVGILDADRDGTPLDDVGAGAVAVGAQHVVTPHVDVDTLAGMDQAGIQVAVLDGIAAAAPEMTTPAVLASRPAHALRHRHQVDARLRQAAGRLDVGPRLVVADETVHVLRSREVEAVVDPAVARVAGGASLPVRLDADAEVVDDRLLPETHRLLPSRHPHRITLPAPVGGALHLGRGVWVALQAGAGDGRTAGVGALHQRGVIGVRQPRRDPRPGVVPAGSDSRAQQHQSDGDGQDAEHHQDAERETDTARPLHRTPRVTCSRAAP